MSAGGASLPGLPGNGASVRVASSMHYRRHHHVIHCIIVLFGCGMPWAAAGQPVPAFYAPGPGLNLPFLFNDTVSSYGYRSMAFGWTWDGTSGSTTTGLARYRPTLENQTSTPTSMPTDQDWVFSLSYAHTGPVATDQAWFLKSHEATLDHKLVSLFGEANGSFSLRAGNAVGGWSTIVPGISLASGLNDFTIHYKTDAQKLDAYLNGSLIASNFTAGHGDYAVDFLQLQPLGGGGTASFSQVRLGQRLDRPADFGEQWVRAHAFTNTALTLRDSLFDSAEYLGANLNTTLVWKTQPGTLQQSVQAGLPWIQRLAALNGPTPEFRSTVNQLVAQYPRGIGFLINDEPETPEHMLATGQALDWLRANHPGLLALSNLGGAPNYEAHVDNYLTLVRPDVLMFDYYPFGPPGVETPDDLITYYRRLAIIRDKAMQANLPYWTFVQAYDSTTPYLSESDLRMQVFASLAHGFTGIAYFTYDPNNDEARTLVDLNGVPTSIYQHASATDAEVNRLGRTLKLLRSIDLGYVATSPAAGLATWDSNDGPYVAGITVQNLGTTNNGQPGDVLVGYFVEDFGQTTYEDNDVYFMVVNLLRAHGAAAAQTQQSIRLAFDFEDSGITSLLRLNRLTGAPERVSLVHDGGTLYHLDLFLPGGTADLFKFTGSFAGIVSGDANLDGAVDTLDFNILAAHFGQSGLTWLDGDFDLNGTVDAIDFATLIGSFGIRPTIGNVTGALAPEPGCVAVLLWSVALRRQQR